MWNSFFGILPGLMLHLLFNSSKIHFSTIIYSHWYTLMTVSVLCFFSQLFFISALKVCNQSIFLFSVSLEALTLLFFLQTNHANVISLTRKSGDIVFAFVVQIILFNDLPNTFSLIGAFLILSTLLATHFRRPSPQIVNLCRLPVHSITVKIRWIFIMKHHKWHICQTWFHLGLGWIVGFLSFYLPHLFHGGRERLCKVERFVQFKYSVLIVVSKFTSFTCIIIRVNQKLQRGGVATFACKVNISIDQFVSLALESDIKKQKFIKQLFIALCKCQV